MAHSGPVRGTSACLDVHRPLRKVLELPLCGKILCPSRVPMLDSDTLRFYSEPTTTPRHNCLLAQHAAQMLGGLIVPNAPAVANLGLMLPLLSLAYLVGRSENTHAST